MGLAESWHVDYGDALELLREMDDASVHCVITSPPYYGLRDYGTGEWKGGDSSCDHLRRDLADNDNLSHSPASTRGGGASRKGADHLQFGSVCEKCGAERVDDQIGLEDTPEEFVAKLVAVFAEVRRVLRDDGTLWLNLGDSYARSAGPRRGNFGRSAKGIGIPENRDSRRRRGELKSKDLIGIPWMMAFALRAEGWYLRSEIIWAKPNPMPASVTDRPTVAHETIFLLAKNERYFYDAVAIREPDKGTDHPRRVHAEPSLEPSGGIMREHTGLRQTDGRNGTGANRRSVWEIPEDEWEQFQAWKAVHAEKPDVWRVATRPYPEAHFATYPAELIEPMVLAGCPRQVCGVCAAPWERIIETSYENPGNRSTNGPRSTARKHLEHGTAGYDQRLERSIKTVGWRSTCEHEDNSGTGVVLDPFAGSGTTLEVAVRNGRRAIGLELNPANERLVQQRMAGVTPSMFDVTTV
jgi:DNA modification methylase